MLHWTSITVVLKVIERIRLAISPVTSLYNMMFAVSAEGEESEMYDSNPRGAEPYWIVDYIEGQSAPEILTRWTLSLDIGMPN